MYTLLLSCRKVTSSIWFSLRQPLHLHNRLGFVHWGEEGEPVHSAGIINLHSESLMCKCRGFTGSCTKVPQWCRTEIEVAARCWYHTVRRCEKERLWLVLPSTYNVWAMIRPETQRSVPSAVLYPIWQSLAEKAKASVYNVFAPCVCVCVCVCI